MIIVLVVWHYELVLAPHKFYLSLSDDGKIFVGSGVGDPFGPRCHKGLYDLLNVCHNKRQLLIWCPGSIDGACAWCALGIMETKQGIF